MSCISARVIESLGQEPCSRMRVAGIAMAAVSSNQLQEHLPAIALVFIIDGRGYPRECAENNAKRLAMSEQNYGKVPHIHRAYWPNDTKRRSSS